MAYNLKWILNKAKHFTQLDTLVQ